MLSLGDAVVGSPQALKLLTKLSARCDFR